MFDHCDWECIGTSAGGASGLGQRIASRNGGSQNGSSRSFLRRCAGGAPLDNNIVTAARQSALHRGTALKRAILHRKNALSIALCAGHGSAIWS